MLRAGSAVNIVATASPGVAEGRDTASRRSLAAAGSSSPDGVVRNLPAAAVHAVAEAVHIGADRPTS